MKGLLQLQPASRFSFGLWLRDIPRPASLITQQFEVLTTKTQRERGTEKAEGKPEQLVVFSASLCLRGESVLAGPKRFRSWLWRAGSWPDSSAAVRTCSSAIRFAGHPSLHRSSASALDCARSGGKWCTH